MDWPDRKTRCPWANPNNPRYLQYHDKEWGVPVHDDQKLFEMLILENFQAGLSWELSLIHISRKRKRKGLPLNVPSWRSCWPSWTGYAAWTR